MIAVSRNHCKQFSDVLASVWWNPAALVGLRQEPLSSFESRELTNTQSSFFHTFFILILIDIYYLAVSQIQMKHAISILRGRKSSWVSRWRALFSTERDGDMPGTPQGFEISGSAKSFNASVQLKIAPPLSQFQ